MKKAELEEQGTVIKYQKPDSVPEINEGDLLVMVDERVVEHVAVLNKSLSKQIGQLSSEKHLKLMTIALKVFSQNVFIFITGIMSFSLFGYSIVYNANPWTMTLATLSLGATRAIKSLNVLTGTVKPLKY